MDLEHKPRDDDDRTHPVHGGSGARRTAVIRLLCSYASESALATEQWAAAMGIHPTDVRAMAELDRARHAALPMTAGSLGASLGLSSPATSALITRLETAGHIQRTRDPEDRRRVLLTASPSAVKGAVAYFRPMGEAVTAALDGSDDQEIAVIERFLERLVERMRDIHLRG